MTSKKIAEPEGELNDQQLLFVGHYLETMSGEQAALKAGYSANSAKQQGSTLLAMPKVQDEIAQRFALLRRQKIIKFDEIVRETERLCYSRLSDYVEWSEDGTASFKQSKDLDPDQAAAISDITIKDGVITHIKLHNKIAAMGQMERWANFGSYTREQVRELLGRVMGVLRVRLNADTLRDVRDDIRDEFNAMGKQPEV